MTATAAPGPALAADTAERDALARLAASPMAYVALALIVILFALPGFFSIPVLDRDEARFVQATRQMLESGDFIQIFIQDEPRNKKPIGIHWIQALTAGLTDQNAVWGYRLASLFGAVMAVWAAFWGGRVLLSPRAALAGAALLGATLLLSTEAMIAKTDAFLCGATALALAAAGRLYMGQGGRRTALLFWAGVGLGVLIKGPITPMVVGLTLLALVLWERRARWLAPLAHWSGPLLAVAITAPWMIAIGIATDGAFFREAIGQDLGPKVAGGHEGHFAPPGVHTALLAFLLFPATLGLIPGVALAWRALRAGAADPALAGVRFLIAWIIPTWLVFEALPTKLVHYPLPTYPALALLCGAGLLTIFSGAAPAHRRPWGSIAVFAVGCLFLSALAGLAATFMPGDPETDLRRAVQAGMIGAGLSLAAVTILARTRRAILALGVALAAQLVALYGVRERLLPEARDLLATQGAVTALSREGLWPLPAERQARLFVVGYRETSMVFATATATRIATGAEAGAQANVGDTLLVNETTPEHGALNEALAERGLAFVPAGPPVLAQNYSNGDDVRLQPGRVTPLAPAPAGGR